MHHTLPRNTFLISQGVDTNGMYPSSIYQILCSIGKGETKLELSRWRYNSSTSMTTAVTVQSTTDLNHLKTIRSNLSRSQKLLILAPYPVAFDLKELVKQWRNESEQNNISLVMMDKETFEEKDMTDVTSIDLAFNIFNNVSILLNSSCTCRPKWKF